MSTWTRAPAALAAALAAVVVGAGAALAAPVAPVPADVQAVFDGAALQQAQVGGEAVDADFSGARVAGAHEVFAFSDAFIDGRPTSEPVTSRDQWLGVLTRGDDVLGTLGVWRTDGGPAYANGYSNDVRTGRALLTLAPAEILVADDPHGAYYAVAGTAVRPLNDWARVALPRPGSLSDLQPAVAEQYAAMRLQTADVEDERSGMVLALVGMAVALLLGGGLLVALRRRRAGAGAA